MMKCRCMDARLVSMRDVRACLLKLVVGIEFVGVDVVAWCAVWCCVLCVCVWVEADLCRVHEKRKQWMDEQGSGQPSTNRW